MRGTSGAKAQRFFCLGVRLKAHLSTIVKRPNTAYRNNKPENSARFLRHTIQVCMPGVSMSVC